MHRLRQTPAALPTDEQEAGEKEVPAAMISSGTQSPAPPPALCEHVVKSLVRLAGTSDTGTHRAALPTLQQVGPRVAGSWPLVMQPVAHPLLRARRVSDRDPSAGGGRAGVEELLLLVPILAAVSPVPL